MSTGDRRGAIPPMDDTAQRSVPASYIQRAMWIAAQRQRGAALNVMALGWRLRGRLRIDALQAALTDLVARHEAFRTRLVMNAGQLKQIVEPTCDVRLVPIAAERTNAADAEQAAWDALRTEARIPIDMTVAPPLRACLVRTGELDHVLALFVHHAMCDGWSGQVITRDFAAFYSARASGAVPGVPALTEQYSDFTQAQIRQYEAGGFSRELAYWCGELDDPPAPLELPSLVSRKGNRDWLAESPTLVESALTVSALKAYAQRRKVSLFSTALAAFSVLMHARTGVRDMLIGVSITNRWTPAAMQIVGCLTNLLPARIRIDPDEAFDTLVVRVHATVRRLLAYGKVPLELILKETRGPFALALGLPVWCQVREAAATCVAKPDGLALTPVLLDRGTILADLDADLVETQSGLVCVFAYRRPLFERAAVTALMRDYLAMLRRLPGEADVRVAALGGGSIG